MLIWRMILRTIVLCWGFLFSVPAFAFEAGSQVGNLPPEAERDGAPQGRLEGPFEFRSKILTGTVRRYWVFVPEQYDPSVPASVLVFQDGQRAVNPQGSLRVPAVLSQLIHDAAIPPTIGIFITPGNLGVHYPGDLGLDNPDNRAAEYDDLSDRYARFLVEEMLPEVGRHYNLTDDPEQRVIGGTSSGAICAFTVAWHRPDQFHKVISFIGSYTSIGFREPSEDNGHQWIPGGQDYPALIRRSPIRPLKIFFQDGSNDLDNEWGDWFLANQQMVKALNYANRAADERGDDGPRYVEKHVWTDGGHSDQQGGALLPEA
ncbi:alpha/beta hydrolase, partial [Pseudomonadota bacterium]